jgi:Fe-Mn family superoxide dismutase
MFKLPDLPYDYNSLEPYIDEMTMRIHHGKHHRAYVENLNKVLSGNEKFLEMEIDELLKDIDKIPENIRQTVINNGGGHANHSFFWKIMCPTERQVSPQGKFLTMLERVFGDFERFKEQFTATAMAVFGSGWAFLILKPDGSISLKRHSFQNSPLMHLNIPLLALDVWEHAYYLKYQNRRADYISAWWNVVNWSDVEKNFLSHL